MQTGAETSNINDFYDAINQTSHRRKAALMMSSTIEIIQDETQLLERLLEQDFEPHGLENMVTDYTLNLAASLCYRLIRQIF